MARIESDIKFGFYPTSNDTVQNILNGYFENEGTRNANISICDPCCGEGEILRVFKEYFPMSKTYGVELDGTRSKVAHEKIDVFLQGDALNFRKGRGAFDILFLNPPYGEVKDINGKSTRLESLFVERWAESVCVGGYIFLVITPLSIIEGNIPITLFSKGFSVLDVFYDEANEDYKRFNQYFIILKRECASRKQTPIEILLFKDSILGERAIEMKEMDKKSLSFIARTKNKILFSPVGNRIEDWQLLKMLQRKENVFEQKINQSYFELDSTSIESPNEGQAIILLMAGLVNEKIANRYLIRGECKKVAVQVKSGENTITTSDHYIGDLYLFDTAEKKYAKLA